MVTSVLLFSVGVITWPLLEYTLHKFSGHIYKTPKAFHVEHQTHHKQKDYFTPTWKKVIAALLFLSILTGINLLWLPLSQAIVFSSGFISMYLFYEWTHFSFHMFEPKTKLGLNLRKHHFSHHFTNSRFNHGVTSTIADHIFKTYRISEKVSIPKSFAMNWLYEVNGLVKSKFNGHFEIRG